MGEGRREWETRLLPGIRTRGEARRWNTRWSTDRLVGASGIRALGEACPTSFDETSLLEGDGEGLRREMLQARASSTSAASRGCVRQ